jgi:hypothetical protein
MHELKKFKYFLGLCAEIVNWGCVAIAWLDWTGKRSCHAAGIATPSGRPAVGIATPSGRPAAGIAMPSGRPAAGIPTPSGRPATLPPALM